MSIITTERNWTFSVELRKKTDDSPYLALVIRDDSNTEVFSADGQYNRTTQEFPWKHCLEEAFLTVFYANNPWEQYNRVCNEINHVYRGMVGRSLHELSKSNKYKQTKFEKIVVSGKTYSVEVRRNFYELGVLVYQHEFYRNRKEFMSVEIAPHSVYPHRPEKNIKRVDSPSTLIITTYARDVNEVVTSNDVVAKNLTLLNAFYNN